MKTKRKVYVVTESDLFRFNMAIFSSFPKAKAFIKSHPIGTDHTYIVEEWNADDKASKGKQVYRKKGTKHCDSDLYYIGTGF